jgi:beta-glucosidase-like glycosyl hydrolase
LYLRTVSGIQKSVIACVKHFIGNEQETNRVPAGANESVSANINDKTMHEQYCKWAMALCEGSQLTIVKCTRSKVQFVQVLEA